MIYKNNEIIFINNDVNDYQYSNSKYKLVIIGEKVSNIGNYAFANSNAEMLIVYGKINVSENAFMSTPLAYDNYNKVYVDDTYLSIVNVTKTDDDLKKYSPELPVKLMHLSVRSANCLQQSIYKDKKIKDLYELTELELLKIRNLGIASVREIMSYINKSKKYNASFFETIGFMNRGACIRFVENLSIKLEDLNFQKSSANASLELKKEKKQLTLEQKTMNQFELSDSAKKILEQIGYINKTLFDFRNIDKEKFEMITLIDEKSYNELQGLYYKEKKNAKG